MKLKKAPVIVNLHPEEVYRADLMKELKINPHDIDRQLLRQPGKYAWWAALYSEVAAKVEQLEIELDKLQGRLALRYAKGRKKGFRVTDIKNQISVNPRYNILRQRLWRWRKSERFLKYSAVRGFEQRKDVIQSYCANQRREREAEPITKKRHRSED